MILVEFSNLTFERAVATKRDSNVKFIPLASVVSRHARFGWLVGHVLPQAARNAVSVTP